jgi:murein DD-endopeptidase MepM/ murein hydrolase activator NlpD
MQALRKRLLIAGKLVLFLSSFFLGETHSKAQNQNIGEQTVHWIWPSNGVITDVFGTRRGVHKGIDIAADAGSPIYAVDDGVVSKSYFSDTYGNVVFIKHKNSFETVYAHLKSRDVSEGKAVKQGEVIGKMGNTGDSSGVHLHFEIHQNEWTFDKHNAINPVIALGNAEVGKSVAADINKVIEVSGRTQPHTQTPIPAVEENVNSGENKIHVVQAGETLWSISQKYGTTVQVLLTINHIHEDKITVNQRINIKPNDSNRYVVKKGDTLSMIALKTNTSIENIKNWNHLSSDIIVPQQVLIVH